MSITHILPTVGGTYTPTERKKKKIPSRGYNPARAPKSKTLLTDHEVLEARWLYEFCGWPPRKVNAHYGLDIKYTYSLLKYATRSKLSPNRDSFPPSHQPPARTPGQQP